MFTVASLWRHPIKSHGREALDSVTLIAGQTMPWDRHWAVTHAATKFDADDPKWVMCRNFMLGVATPGLAGILAKLNPETATVTLDHADLGTLTFAPDDPAQFARFAAWVTPLCPKDKHQPTGIAKAPQRGMTDSPYPSLSIMTTASHNAVADQLGAPLEIERWRGNIWLDGPNAWSEFDWTNRDIRIGGAILAVREPIQRCMATSASPKTGLRDHDTLGALRDGWGHQNFGIYAEVIKGGDIQIGDTAEVL